MEATPFEMILVPVCQTTVATVAACWLLSKLAGWAGTAVRLLFGDPGEVERSLEPPPIAWFTSGTDVWASARGTPSAHERDVWIPGRARA